MRKKYSITKLLALTIISALMIASTASATTYSDGATQGTIKVTATVSSSYSITLNPNLALSNSSGDTYTGTYTVGVKANLKNNECVTVTPQTLKLSNGHDEATAVVTQTITKWKNTPTAADEIACDRTKFIETTGTVSVTLTNSGNYAGDLNFTFAKSTY